MVGTVKRWLGIDALERESLILAKVLAAQAKRLEAVEEDARKTSSQVAELQKGLTSTPVAPKIESKTPAPKRVNWSQARQALERASESEEDEE